MNLSNFLKLVCPSWAECFLIEFGSFLLPGKVKLIISSRNLDTVKHNAEIVCDHVLLLSHFNKH